MAEILNPHGGVISGNATGLTILIPGGGSFNEAPKPPNDYKYAVTTSASRINTRIINFQLLDSDIT